MIAKRKGVVARRGLKEAWSKDASRWTKTGYKADGCRTSELRVAKSTSIKGTGCRFGGCALKVVEITSGDLLLVTISVTEEGVIPSDPTAEVSRGHSSPAARAG